MERAEFGEAWVYESIVGAIPGVHLSDRAAVAVQFALFEAGVVVLAALYGRWDAVLPGTLAVVVAAAGSAFMLDIGARLRAVSVPEAYRSLLFGTSVEVVLGLLAYVAVLTYLFVYDLRAAPVLVADLFGERPPLPAVYLALLVLWDVCYRIGTAWWTAVVGVWRSYVFEVDAETARRLRATDYRVAAFGLLQLSLVVAVSDHPVLAGAVVGHVAATLVAVGVSTYFLRS